MKLTITALLLSATLAAGGAFAQSAPVGGSDAKVNAPIKHAHSINDGSAKPGANSFTRSQAIRHIEHTGYTGVSGLMQGEDGVWRGTAMKGGASVAIAMDYKGNVTQGMAPVAANVAAASPANAPSSSESSMTTAAPAVHRMTQRHHRHHHRGAVACNTTPGPNGVACSGRDRNRNGVSDKEDRAMQQGAKP